MSLSNPCLLWMDIVAPGERTLVLCTWFPPLLETPTCDNMVIQLTLVHEYILCEPIGRCRWKVCMVQQMFWCVYLRDRSQSNVAVTTIILALFDMKLSHHIKTVWSGVLSHPIGRVKPIMFSSNMSCPKYRLAMTWSDTWDSNNTHPHIYSMWDP